MVCHPGGPADSRNFVGNARVKRLPMVQDAAPVIVYLVDFAPGGRTNWHTHSAPQLLLVVDGHGLIQKWGEAVRTITAGDAVTIEPNEKNEIHLTLVLHLEIRPEIVSEKNVQK